MIFRTKLATDQLWTLHGWIKGVQRRTKGIRETNSQSCGAETWGHTETTYVRHGPKCQFRIEVRIKRYLENRDYHNPEPGWTWFLNGYWQFLTCLGWVWACTRISYDCNHWDPGAVRTAAQCRTRLKHHPTGVRLLQIDSVVFPIMGRSWTP